MGNFLFLLGDLDQILEPDLSLYLIFPSFHHPCTNPGG